MKPLPRSYYEENDVLFLAKDLLGKVLYTKFNEQITSAWITETEAYRAPEDKASHAFGNRRTKRTETMFGPGGYAYVYLNYGIHHLFNIVCGPRETAHAVLIRGIQPLKNVELQLKRRQKEGEQIKESFFNGPGKLTQALGILTLHNGIDLCDKNSPIQIHDHGQSFQENEIIKGPRVGIDYAEEWVDKPWRFQVKLTSK